MREVFMGRKVIRHSPATISKQRVKPEGYEWVEPTQNDPSELGGEPSEPHSLTTPARIEKAWRDGEISIETKDRMMKRLKDKKGK